ncbi:MAG: hypothetical protein PHG39_05695 [Acidithiobacillus ferrooxidans]|uniref:hypothetical protein n=1 Tax=Acidithiobacillus sp. TaxID=1872118 RepID=UPI0029F8E7C0|nr:hypothetical protein [Candidatus Neomarinimicrobiota bacterium]MDD2747030.1 hypothetical protein [Acidithiobacillus ferrooxidans]MDD5003173.1 hypothetical protein [Acidithiobacillus sp.]MDD5378722.1 hypothetical protein [Acidithiobacillus sp.]MDD5577405.1 hypothetical protein [Acidithiobacillus sp.]
MKEPVSLDLFPVDVIPAEDVFIAHLKLQQARRERFLFLIERPFSQNAFALQNYRMRLRSACAVLDSLGGLGGVW